ncbi:hypothetical protein OHB56_01080 [Streptomyces sp. NBC_01635]|nr:hypothetical protein OHB56_01080 [Streptomyces sp. NBC_01635]
MQLSGTNTTAWPYRRRRAALEPVRPGAATVATPVLGVLTLVPTDIGL